MSAPAGIAKEGFVRGTTWAPLRVGTRVDVRCHAGCPWMDRFVINEVAWIDGEPAYRVHRVDANPDLSIAVPASDVRAARS
jgi:hypothetical protein